MGNTGSSSCADQPVGLWAETSSSVGTTAEPVTGAHNFVVMMNNPLLHGMGVGESLTSSTFSVGGHRWCIRFYPDGDGREPGYAGAYLCPGGGDVGEKGVRVKYTLSLREKDGRVHTCSTPLTETRTFKPGDLGWGHTKLLRKSDLRRDRFIIRCELTVVQKSIVQMMMPREMQL